jgi:hypothetical protein
VERWITFCELSALEFLHSSIHFFFIPLFATAEIQYIIVELIGTQFSRNSCISACLAKRGGPHCLLKDAYTIKNLERETMSPSTAKSHYTYWPL